MIGPPMPVEAETPLSTEKKYTLQVSAHDMMHILTAFMMSQQAGRSEDEKMVANDLLRQFQKQARPQPQ